MKLAKAAEIVENGIEETVLSLLQRAAAGALAMPANQQSPWSG